VSELKKLNEIFKEVYKKDSSEIMQGLRRQAEYEELLMQKMNIKFEPQVSINQMKTYLGAYHGHRATYSPYVATELAQKIIGDIIKRENISSTDYPKMLIAVSTSFLGDNFEVSVRMTMPKI
jgi:hypothetical protein